jgi:hypothetical protein
LCQRDGSPGFLVGINFHHDSIHSFRRHIFFTSNKSNSTTYNTVASEHYYASTMMDDPTTKLPRDPTGSYLHLKLKRYPSINDLTMNYAKQTWREVPHDAEVDVSPSSKSSCRQCHKKIHKGQTRFRLWLQCDKGCKISAYFHHSSSCIWKYPETAKLESLEEILGFQQLPKKRREEVEKDFHFHQMKEKNPKKKETDHESPRKKKREAAKDFQQKMKNGMNHLHESQSTQKKRRLG